MDQTLADLIATWGYPAIFVLTFFEGEMAVIAAGFAASRGYLTIEGVALAAFLGTLAGDQLYFHLGRRYGGRLLGRFPRFAGPAARAAALLHRYSTWYILAFRFVYGIRTVSPFVIGAAGIGRLRFAILNALSAAIWAVAVAAAGYVFGAAVELLIGDIKRIEIYVLGAILAAGAIGIAIAHIRRRRPRP
ncbi:MAG: DedA family protein [Rhodospirillales bacterium]|nr:DedA family protein [Rhodospirillales bacterium]